MGSSLAHCVCLWFLLVSITNAKSHVRNVFNVMSYGAVADGKTDNSKAIFDAWTHACQSVGGGMVLIPKGTYLVNPVVLKGTCKGQMVFFLQGDLKAPTDQKSWDDIDHWITFQYVDNFVMSGGGSLDGQGASAWPYNTCNKDSHCKKLPVSLRLDFVNNAWISYIKLINSKNFHMNIFACNNIKLEHMHIMAPGDSPNTDGIHIALSTGIKVWDSIISTGDDCLSFGPGMKDVDIWKVQCGPGHGISIGSLGSSPNEKDVQGFIVRNSRFIGTQNGVRIKTWALPHASNVYNITFRRIIMQNVANPIVIDQEYCPSGKCNPQGSSQIQIRDVKFMNIWGTSSSKVAVNLDCSKGKPCQQIVLKDIYLAYKGKDGPAISQCSNVNGVSYGKLQPPSCIQKSQSN
ncbi:hypothetical protein L484_014009 [Morus notabilis]|uniref:Exopolygalacturonase n=1 Tax=Morus notabilis TaxID=981085 RepID=W9RBH8_9ROSA|nr:hypothetical protein L484_014009 [Morus notabilis]